MNEMASDRGWHGTGGSGRRWGAIGTVAVAAALQLVVLVPFTVASGLVAPLWAVLLLYAAWIVGALVLLRLAQRRPFATPVVPVANAGVLWLVITLGEQWLGWTA